MKTFKNIVLVFLALMILTGCRKEEYIIATSEDVLMGTYFEQESETFSGFYEILERSGTVSFLKAYGTYTCFAPTNEAVDAFLQKHGKSSVNDFTPEELKTLVRYHVIVDTINSTRFTDGKLPAPTMYGQYLTAGTFFEEGEAKIKINKYSEVEHVDIRVANGIVHSVKTMLEPVTSSVAELIEQDSQLSIFSDALKLTGLYDTLKLIPTGDLPVEEKRWFTVFATTDEVYAEEGIFSVDDLVAKYQSTTDPKNREDSLYMYVAYHILDNSLKYVGDIVTEPVHNTFVPQEVITIRLKTDSVLINEDVFQGILEKGSPVNRALSDNTAGNGVYHILSKDIFIKVRFPIRIYWDVCDQPELRKLAGVFRTPGSYVALVQGQLEDVTWGGNASIYYDVHADFWADHLIYMDCFSFSFRTAVVPWIEFKTPVLVKGRYKMWMCTRNSTDGADMNRRPKFLAYFNDEVLPNVINTGVQLSSTLTDEELELQGFKRYSYHPDDSVTLTDRSGRWVGQLAGTIEVPNTGRHTIKCQVINNGDKGFWIDMIQFIPVEEDQLWPRINNEGILCDKPEWYPKQ